MDFKTYDSYEIELLELITRKYDQKLENEIGLSISNNLILGRNLDDKKDEIILSIKIIGHKILDNKEDIILEDISEKDMGFEINLVYKLETIGTERLSDDELNTLSKNIAYPTIKHDAGEMFLKIGMPIFPFPKEALGID